MSNDHATITEDRPSLPLSLPLKTRISVALLTRVTDASRRSDGTINRRLLGFLDFRSPASPKPVNGVSTSDITVDPDRNLWFRVFSPVDAGATSQLPVIVFFHGGGFNFLSAASKAYDVIGRYYARKLPAVFVSVNYRLSPEHRFPSQYEDGSDVLKFLDSKPEVLPSNADLSKTFLCGDSAGGNIAHHVAVRACQSDPDTLKRVKLVGMISMQPFFGGIERTESETRLVRVPLLSLERTDWCWKAFIPDGDRDHWAINVSGPNAVDLASLERFPDTLVITGGHDPLRDWQKKYYEWLKRCGKEAEMMDYPSACHAFYIFPELQESRELVTEVKRFVTQKAGQ
ncbi:hypothetical protein MLD38_016264 [Melastoma candidum]|uniref:Uncharacterized protein n=1 Tax=Melastoma candidum TaxID=119954 RepID=A0ACB9RIQ3_9MYRT|nr:hypothetical protein MLD38_016264 [Melastoma candidum]